MVGIVTAGMRTASPRALCAQQVEPDIRMDMQGSGRDNYGVIYWENFLLDGGATTVSFCVRWFPHRSNHAGGAARYELDVRFRQVVASGLGRSNSPLPDAAAGLAGMQRPVLIWDAWDSVAFDWSAPSTLPRTNGHLEVDSERRCIVSHLVPSHREVGCGPSWHLLLSWPCDGNSVVPAGLQAKMQLQDGRRLQHPANQCFLIPLCGDPSVPPELSALPQLPPKAVAQVDSSLRVEAIEAQIHEMRIEAAKVRASIEDTNKALAEVEECAGEFRAELASRPSLAVICSLQAKLEQEAIARRIHQEQIMTLRGRIRIFCRIRPHENSTPFLAKAAVAQLSQKEVSMPSLHRQFEFDLVFGPESPTANIWEETWPLIDSVFEQPGTSCCVMAYGQTGAGKTFTMEGAPNQTGIIGLAVDRIFRKAEREEEERRLKAGGGNRRRENGQPSNPIQISISMLEVYQEQLKDLLAGQDGGPRLTMRNIGGEGGPEIRDLQVRPTKSCEDAIAIYQAAARLRRLGSSEKNARSSRSHLVLTLYVQRLDSCGGEVVSTSKVSLVDLAGSERQSATTAFDRSRVSEASVINNSLSSLSKVVQACVTRAASPRPEKAGLCHIPYRDSVLTQLLSDSIGGQGKTLVVVHVTQHEEDVMESLRTLQFAANAACVQERTAPKAEEEKVRRQVAKMITDNQRLTKELAAAPQCMPVDTPQAKGHGSPRSDLRSPRVLGMEREASPRALLHSFRDDSPRDHLASTSALGSPRVASPRQSSPTVGAAGTSSPCSPGRKYATRPTLPLPGAQKLFATRGGG